MILHTPYFLLLRQTYTLQLLTFLMIARLELSSCSPSAADPGLVSKRSISEMEVVAICATWQAARLRAKIENGEISVSLNLFFTKVEYPLIDTSVLLLLFTKSLILNKLELTKLGCLLYITLSCIASICSSVQCYHY